MTKQHVDYAGSPFPVATLDTGTTDATAIRPIVNGEVATQATLQRPDENLRTRTEIIRTELEQLKYLSDADRAMVMSIEPVTPAGTITWKGISAVIPAENGKFTLTLGKRLTIRPFLAPRASTPAKVISRAVKFQTNLTVAGPINPPRAYGNANKYNIQFVNQIGAAVTVTYDPLLFRFTINTDTRAAPDGRTNSAVINAFNSAATAAGQGITATLNSGLSGDVFAVGETFVQGGPLDYLVFAGAADAEIHQIEDTTFASFFTDPLNELLENDVLAIWYDDHINGLFGGRQQSIIDTPEAPTISAIPVGSLFLARRFPERLHLSIPIATVVNNELLLADGTVARKGIATAMTGGASELPPPVGPDNPPKFLRMFTSGLHLWETVDDIDLIGGLMSVANTAARDAILAAQRKEGMVVYSQADDRHFVLEGGLTNSDWKEFSDDGRLVGGFRVLSWTAAPADGETQLQTFINTQVPAAKRKVGMLVVVRETVTGLITKREWSGATWTTTRPEVATMGVVSGCLVTNPTTNNIVISAGEFYTPRGKKIIVPTAVTVTVMSANRVVYWDDSFGSFTTGFPETLAIDDMPFAFASYDGTYLTKFYDLRAVWTGHGVMSPYLSVGSAAGLHFTRLDTALRWLSMFDDDSSPALPRVVRVVDDITLPSLTTLGTVNVSVGGLVTGTGTRFKRDLLAGDLVRVNSLNWLVSSITDDTNMTLSPYTGGVLAALTLQRCDSASSYAPHMDMTNVSLSPNTLVGVEIRGPEWSDADRPIVSWGSSTYAATRPLFNMNGQVAHMTLDNIGFTYNGLLDATKTDNVWIKNPAVGLTMTRVKVTGGLGTSQSLTALVSLGTNFGGKNEEPGLVVTQCAFLNILGIGTAWFQINAVGAAGKLTCRDSEFEVTLSGDTDFLIANPSDFAHTADFLFENDEIANIATLVYDERTLAQSNKVFSRCSFGNKFSDSPMRTFVRNDLGVSLTGSGIPIISAPVLGVVTVTGLAGINLGDEGALVTIAGHGTPANNGTFVIRRRLSGSSIQIYNPNAVAAGAAGTFSDAEPLNTAVHVDFVDCVYGDDIDFIGARRAGGRFIAAVTYNIRNAVIIDADFSLGTALTAAADASEGFADIRGVFRTRDDVNYLQRKVRTREAFEWLQAFMYLGSDTIQRPFVGFNLYPTVIKSGVDYHAGAQFSGGWAVFPNGKLAYAVLGDDTDLFSVREMDGSAYFEGEQYYFFLRYDDALDNPGMAENISTLVYTRVPPDVDGSLGPTQTPQGGFAKTDYLYIGILITGPKATGTTPDEPDALWGSCRVVHENSSMGPKRRVYFPYISDVRLFNGQTNANSNITTSSQQNIQPVALRGPAVLPAVSGLVGNIASKAGNIITLTGLTGILTSFVGKIIRLTGCGSPMENNGEYQIIERVSITSVTIWSKVGIAADTNNGAINWEIFESINFAYPTASVFGLTYKASLFGPNGGVSRYFLRPSGMVQGVTGPSCTTINTNAHLSISVEAPRKLGTYKPVQEAVIGNPTTVDAQSDVYIDYLEEFINIPTPDETPNQGEDL